MLTDFVLDPLKGNSLLINCLEEHLFGALHHELKLHIITSNGSLQFLLSRLAICIGQPSHVDHIYNSQIQLSPKLQM